MRRDWSSDAYPICCAFPVSETRACPECSCFGEILPTGVHRFCLGLCPHPHGKWCIQTYSISYADQLQDRPCQSHLFCTMVWRLPYISISLIHFNLYVLRLSSKPFHILQDKHSIPLTVGCTNIQCRPCIWYDGCRAGFFDRGMLTYLTQQKCFIGICWFVNMVALLM
jgi:hypothetical protein